ncbi:hypothetical protein [Kitasatospora sp. DSM 101779]|uniref:hypothetical protein n=1 Tax=Kitasatospora sp. DSM 101779 TaxID=2853165 RepID=UPI0021D957BD|nr:hypothetical protein [Kitasatospora sp. DSM 101779]MCU7827248.1 hypothetical protein [Kitasatospora sp. DSM 101779]
MSHPSVVYAANQPLDGFTTRCQRDATKTRDVFSCAPLPALETGAVVIALEPWDPNAAIPTPAPTLTPAAAPGASCRSLGGQLEYASALVLPAEDGHPALQVSICVAPAPGTGEPSPSRTSTPEPNEPGTRDVTITPAAPATSAIPALEQARTLLRTVHFG